MATHYSHFLIFNLTSLFRGATTLTVSVAANAYTINVWLHVHKCVRFFHTLDRKQHTVSVKNMKTENHHMTVDGHLKPVNDLCTES